MYANICAAWIGILLGCLAGAVIGLRFARADWMGGYDSWRRRLTRLGHIAFFGVAFLNLSLALTARSLGIEDGLAAASVLLIVGAATMPLVCFLAAWRKPFRHAFPVPALSVTLGVVLFLWRIIVP
jgi:hypothetical protein